MSVDFEPVRLDPPHRRSELVLVAMVIVGLVAVLLKPWDGPPATGLIPPIEPSGPPPSATIATPVTPPVKVIETPTWGELVAVVTAHRVWGIRVLLLDPASDTPSTGQRPFVERWVEASPRADGASATDIEVDARVVVAIGVTFPVDRSPIDVRVRQVQDDLLQSVDAQPIPPALPGGSSGAFLLVRPGTDPSGVLPWATGTYVMDVVTTGGIHRITIDIHTPAPPPFRNPASA